MALSQKEISKIEKMLQNGATYDQIQKKLHVSLGVISKVKKDLLAATTATPQAEEKPSETPLETPIEKPIEKPEDPNGALNKELSYKPEEKPEIKLSLIDLNKLNEQIEEEMTLEEIEAEKKFLNEKKEEELKAEKERVLKQKIQEEKERKIRDKEKEEEWARETFAKEMKPLLRAKKEKAVFKPKIEDDLEDIREIQEQEKGTIQKHPEVPKKKKDWLGLLNIFSDDEEED